MGGERHVVDRLWPNPVDGIPLDDVLEGFRPPGAAGRPGVAINMVTSIDGRAQLEGTAEGLGSRVDRRLMRLYRAAFDAVASGAGTLRQAGAWLRVGDDLAHRRAAEERSPHPTGVIIAGEHPVPVDARWFSGDEKRILIVGSTNPMTEVPIGTELLRAPRPRPEPIWVLERLAERGVDSVLLEGGPTLNAAFLADDLIEEVYWTIGPHLLATDALPMIAPIESFSPNTSLPRTARLVAAFRHEDELFLRYRLRPAVG